jgi:hypothetical protein
MIDKQAHGPTPKTLALAAIRDAREEAGRKDGLRPVVLGALLSEAEMRVDAIAELKRPGRKTATRVTP